MREPLRLLTYLAPGLPLRLFETVSAVLGRGLGRETLLASDATRSGPDPDDPSSLAGTDLAFVCAPSYLALGPALELVPAAFVFDDARNGGRPLYFADLVVRSTSPAASLLDLGGARCVYNDPLSLSGYFSVLSALEERGRGPGMFASMLPLGSHHACLRAVEAGTADVAAIDSNTLLLERRAGRARGLRVLETLGPYPVQPIVARAGEAGFAESVAAILLAPATAEAARAELAQCGVRGFAPVSRRDYEPEWARLACLGLAAKAVGAPAEPTACEVSSVSSGSAIG